MANEDQPDGDLVPEEDRAPAKVENNDIILGNANALKTHGLNDDQIAELRMQHAKGMIDLNKKAVEIGIDVLALSETLGTMAEQTEQVSRAGDSVTITHSQSNTVGRTEVVMGNTDRAASGKLSKSQSGEDDHTLKYVIIGAVVVIVVAFIAFQGNA